MDVSLGSIWGGVAIISKASGVTAATIPSWAQVPLIIVLSTALVTVCVFLYRREAAARKEEAARADRLEAENKRLYEDMIERFLPAVIASTQAQQRSAELTERLLERMRGAGGNV